jgi:hypothetical protein
VSLILASGTRHATIADHGLIVERATLRVLEGNGPHGVYVGDEPDGLDAIIAGLARRNSWGLNVFEALWEECGPGCPATPHRRRRRRTGEIYCPYAGPRRNERMVRKFRVDGGKDMLGFPAANAPSPGTENCLRQARKAGLIVPDENIIPLEVRRGRP